jgi:hypothetical protein
MENAFCTINQQTYDAFQFSLLGEDQISALRHDLLCCDCKGQASFRSKSRNGRVACFSAYHLDGCAAKGWSKGDLRKNSIEAIYEAEKIITDDSILEIAPVQHGMPVTLVELDSAPRIQSGSVSTAHTRTPQRGKPTRRSLAALLHLLAKTDNFSQSNVRIRVSLVVRPVRDACVN